jgi:hypothetical protein
MLVSVIARQVALTAVEVDCLGDRLVVAGVEQLSISASASSLERFVEASLVVSVFDDKPDCATSEPGFSCWRRRYIKTTNRRHADWLRERLLFRGGQNVSRPFCSRQVPSRTKVFSRDLC